MTIAIEQSRPNSTKDESIAPVVAFLLFLVGVSILVGAALGAAMESSPSFQNITPVNLDAKVLQNYKLEQMVPSFDVVVRFRDEDGVRAICGPHADACSLQSFAGAPCFVTLPANWTINFFPHDQIAYASGGVPIERLFAHEVLHCIHPNWHQPFTDAMK